MQSIKWIIILCLLSLPINAEKLVEIDFLISNDDYVSLENIRTFEGVAPNSQEGDYVISLKDNQNNLVNQVPFDSVFLLLDPTEEVNEIPATITLPYKQQTALEIQHKDKIIFSDNLNLCDNDNTCQENENVISCPKDCPSGGKDLYCDRIQDDICDPDCIKNNDPDCSGINYLFVSIGLLFLIGSSVGLYHFLRK
jgi:hypothetical protein